VNPIVSKQSLVLGLSLLVACSSTDSTNDLELTTTETGVAAGAVLGAGIGAIIGSASGNAGEGLVIGSLAGAATGGLVGDAIEGQEEVIENQENAIREQQELIDEQRRQLDEIRGVSSDTRSAHRNASSLGTVGQPTTAIQEEEVSLPAANKANAQQELGAAREFPPRADRRIYLKEPSVRPEARDVRASLSEPRATLPEAEVPTRRVGTTTVKKTIEKTTEQASEPVASKTVKKTVESTTEVVVAKKTPQPKPVEKTVGCAGGEKEVDRAARATSQADKLF